VLEFSGEQEVEMTIVSPVDKAEILRDLDELPPEALSEVRQFIDYQKFKAQSAAQAPAVAIRGWLSGYHFDSGEIARAREEMWPDTTDKPA
jgi:hypothetical protein